MTHTTQTWRGRVPSVKKGFKTGLKRVVHGVLQGGLKKGLKKGFQRGFTLIELMVVLVIIGVLAALIVPNVLDRADDARAIAAKTDITNLMQALKLYKLDNQRFPTAEQGLQALMVKPASGPIPGNWKPYLTNCPTTPGAVPICTSIPV